MDHTNAVEDHVHILFRLDVTQTVLEALRILKGGSSFYLNRTGSFKKENTMVQ